MSELDKLLGKFSEGLELFKTRKNLVDQMEVLLDSGNTEEALLLKKEYDRYPKVGEFLNQK